MTQPPMDENDLARFLDGEMSEEERGGAVAHLSESDADAELLADAAYMLRELEAEDGVVPLTRPEPRHPHVDEVDKGTETGKKPPRPPSTERLRPRRRISARWLALAAVLAGVVLIPFALSRSRGPAGPGEFAALLAARDAGLPDGWTAERPWGRVRGSGDPLTDHREGQAARLGALWVDFELAVASGQVAQADTLCGDIDRVLGEVSSALPGTSRCAEIQSASSPARQKALLEEGREGVAGIFEDDAHFALGAWAEAAHLAAARQDAAFFAAKQSRSALDEFAGSTGLTPAAREAAQQVRARLQADGPPAWPALQSELGQLLRVAHLPAFE
ncbi:MAG TPA: hypothetical protein VHG93_05730 [Longimicrobium sp.]|nr:hypothetical protein [Longimicrobium sp.]